jgi:gliding motility-associated-like protein
MDGDGLKDLVLGSQFSNSSQPGSISIYRGTPTGPSTSSLIHKQFSGGFWLVTHDVNGDGKEDIISTSFNIYGDYLAILLNTTSVVTCVPPSVVSLSPDADVCEGEPAEVLVTAGGSAPLTYQWKKNSVNIPGATSDEHIIISAIAQDAGTYSVEITNSCGTITSGPSNLTVSMVASPNITNASRCDDGVVVLAASGATNGNYRWYELAVGGAPISGQVNDSFTTPFLTSTTSYFVSIVSGSCESSREQIIASIGGVACTNQPPVIAISSLVVSFEGTATFDLLSFISDADGNLDVGSLKITVPPASDALATLTDGILELSYEGTGFSGTEMLTIEACDLLGSCVQQQVTIEVTDDTIIVYNGISPNGDLLNASWQIQNIAMHPDTQQNKVSVYNRWGDEVFSETNYDNVTRVFKGLSKNGSELPSGTYFYTIDFAGRASKRGYLVLKR